MPSMLKYFVKLSAALILASHQYMTLNVVCRVILSSSSLSSFLLIVPEFL